MCLQTDDLRPVSDVSDLSPPVPQRPSDSILESIRLERALELAGVSSAASQNDGGTSHDTDAVAIKQDPDYQEIDDRDAGKSARESTDKALGKSAVRSSGKSLEKSVGKSAGRSAGPPEVRIERKLFPCVRPPQSLASSTNGSEEMLLELPCSSRQPDIKPACQPCLVQAPPVNSMCPLLFIPSTSHTSATKQSFIPLSLAPPHSNHTVSALATLPRRHRDSTKATVSAYTNQCVDTHIVDRRLLVDADKTWTKPPTPPMRRQPSWVGFSLSLYTGGATLSFHRHF